MEIKPKNAAPPASSVPEDSEANLVERRFLELEKSFSVNRPKEDVTKLRTAFEFARDQHAGQARKSGESFILHPLAVAKILADMHMDLVCVETALLHDVVEDTGITRSEEHTSELQSQ